MYLVGSRLNEKWAIIPICWVVHRGSLLNKQINEWLALNRATDEELAKYPRAKFKEQRDRLNRRYGVPDLSTGYAPF